MVKELVDDRDSSDIQVLWAQFRAYSIKPGWSYYENYFHW